MTSEKRTLRIIGGAWFVCTLIILTKPAFAANTTITTFQGGDTQGWQGTGGFGGSTFVDFTDGNPPPSFRTSFPNFAVFGITFSNTANPAYLGDYTHAPFTIGIDTKTTLVGSFQPSVRDLVLELRDYDSPPSGYPYVSVYYDLGDLRDPNAGGSGMWEHSGVAVSDPTQATLPQGWGGTGAEDPVTFEPRLPPNRTFASVLSSVDEVVFTTFKPGFFYIDQYFDVSVDNIRVDFVPEPGAGGLISAGLLAISFMRRRAHHAA
jgi:hypothetical protein